MDTSRAAQLTYLRFQVRSLKQSERRLQRLYGKPSSGNRAEFSEELVRVRQQVQDAEDVLADALRGSAVNLS